MDLIDKEINETLKQKRGLEIQLEEEKKIFINELKSYKTKLKANPTEITIIKIPWYKRTIQTIKMFLLKF
jgi:hypothetical protein